MKTDEDLRQQMISTATAFRFDQRRLDATTIARTGQQRRRRRRFVGAAAVIVALTASATMMLTQRGDSPDSVVSLSSGEVYLVPEGTPQGLVLRRSTAFTPIAPASYFSAFYSDGGSKRIVVITVLRDGLEATTAGRALPTSSGFTMSWRPQPGVEVDIATVGMSQQETEALVDRLGVEPNRGLNTYGLLTLPSGFRFVGNERDTTISGATLNVYAAPDANIAGPPSRQPRADVTVGRASDVYREIDRIIFDERATASIRGHEAEVVTHRADADHGSIVTVTWFEQPGVLANVTTYNMTADDAVAFARSLQPVTSEEWTAHKASTAWMTTQQSITLPAIGPMERSAPLVAKTSFDEVVQLYRLPMLRLARFLLGPHGSVEDVVHDAFLKTYLRLDRVDNPSAYLRRCVTNACRSEHRRRAVFQRIAPKLASRIPHTEPGDYLLDAIHRLPYRQRVAVVLRYYEDLSNDDIAATLRCTTKAAESLVHNGIQSLRRYLGPENRPES